MQGRKGIDNECEAAQYTHSLNRDIRKRELQRITAENQVCAHSCVARASMRLSFLNACLSPPVWLWFACSPSVLPAGYITPHPNPRAVLQSLPVGRGSPGQREVPKEHSGVQGGAAGGWGEQAAGGSLPHGHRNPGVSAVSRFLCFIVFRARTCLLVRAPGIRSWCGCREYVCSQCVFLHFVWETPEVSILGLIVLSSLALFCRESLMSWTPATSASPVIAWLLQQKRSTTTYPAPPLRAEGAAR